MQHAGAKEKHPGKRRSHARERGCRLSRAVLREEPPSA